MKNFVAFIYGIIEMAKWYKKLHCKDYERVFQKFINNYRNATAEIFKQATGIDINRV